MTRLIPMLLIIGLVACKSSQQVTSDQVIIEMKKTPCLGTCPEYELTIFQDKRVVVEAKQHTPLGKGKYSSKLSDEQYDQLVQEFVSADFFEFEEEYTSSITDLPTTYLTFRHNGKEKKVMDYHGAPESLKNLEKQVHALIEELEWQSVEEG